MDGAAGSVGWVRLLRRSRHAAAARLCSRCVSWWPTTLDNVVPACPSCNASKCNFEVTGWLRRKRLDERAFLLRHIEVRVAPGRSQLRSPRPPSTLRRR